MYYEKQKHYRTELAPCTWSFCQGHYKWGLWKTILLLLSSVLPVTNLFGKVLKFATNIEGELDEWEGGRGVEPVYTVSKNCL